MMKPILFNTEMVRAILAGQKTCTRRLVKPQLRPGEEITENLGYRISTAFVDADDTCWIDFRYCPYNGGDVLYVRETWCRYEPQDVIDGVKYAYRADANADTEKIRKEMGYKWHPSIHMPKEAARIFLRVTDVDVERLQDIDFAGCKAEGIWDDYKAYSQKYHDNLVRMAYLKAFAGLWDSGTIKPADRDRYGWDANPWVWVIQFQRIPKEASGK